MNYWTSHYGGIALVSIPLAWFILVMVAIGTGDWSYLSPGVGITLFILATGYYGYRMELPCKEKKRRSA